MERASARALGGIDARSRAEAMAGEEWPAARRLLARVFLFCAKTARRKGRNGAWSIESSAKRGANRQRQF